MNLVPHTSVIDAAPLATYAAASTAITVWGLHLSDFAVIVSSLAAVCGAVIQVLSYLERQRERAGGEETSHDGETH